MSHLCQEMIVLYHAMHHLGASTPKIFAKNHRRGNVSAPPVTLWAASLARRSPGDPGSHWTKRDRGLCSTIGAPAQSIACRLPHLAPGHYPSWRHQHSSHANLLNAFHELAPLFHSESLTSFIATRTNAQGSTQNTITSLHQAQDCPATTLMLEPVPLRFHACNPDKYRSTASHPSAPAAN